MSKITVYSSMLCPYCHRAKRLLRAKGASYEEIDVGFHPSRRAEMEQRASGRSSVPQIFIGERHIGGCDDLYALEQQGELDALLADADAAADEPARSRVA